MGEMSIDQINETKTKKNFNNCSVNFNDCREMCKSKPIKLAMAILSNTTHTDLDLNGKFFELQEKFK